MIARTNGHDFYISDLWNNSNGNFPKTCNREGGDKIVNNQANHNMFSGAKKISNCRVVDYEVFQAIYKWSHFQ